MRPDFRKLLADVKQWKEPMELTFERLPETCKGSRRRRASGRYTGRI